MKKEIEELKRKLAEAEKRIAALEKEENKIEYRFHSHPPVYVQPNLPLTGPYWPGHWPFITCGTETAVGDKSGASALPTLTA